VQDNVVAFPAVLSAGAPWVRIASCNPLEIQDPVLPPPLSGLPSADPAAWDAFRRAYRETLAPLHERFDGFTQSHGCPPLPRDEFMYESPHLNLYIYPADADYNRSVPLAPTWQRLESCVRATDEPFALPDALQGPGKLLYLSLGSLGSADTELMTRLIDLLGRTEHRVIVSMGPQQGHLALPDNMYGAEFLPQPSILPLVDLVITHGGNNTVTECFHNGKPMLALPLFWDQHDNAQRLDETGFGVRLPTYSFTDAEFYAAIDRLLSDATLHGRMREIAARLQAHPGTETATLIENIAAHAHA
jgi:UDP:flavonoid glycosyltransferase YjiC (YdhE family)